jgi:predicted CoA-binding protein
VREEVEIVDVFRRPEELLNVIGDAIKKKGIKVIWMQLGVYNEEAVKKAREYGFDVVCMME